MSRIHFHSQHGEAEVSGRERAMMGMRVDRLLIEHLGLSDPYEKDPRKHALYPYLRGKEDRHYALEPDATYDTLRLALRSLFGTLFIEWEGQLLNTWELALNTAIAAGSDPIRLSARLHAQCEIWTWVEGPNRRWLADIIEEGRETGVFRPNAGWEDTIKLLRKRKNEPVVTSYSVCESFPNYGVADWKAPISEDDGEPVTDAWYDLPVKERWELSLKGLRRDYAGNELKPEDWKGYTFGSSNLNAFTLMAAIHAKQEPAKTS